MSAIDRPTSTEVAPAEDTDLSQVSTVLADAFYDDPVFTWLCPDADRRRAVLPGWFAAITRGLQHHGTTYMTADGTGAAVWTPPGRPLVDDPGAFARSILEVSPPDAERFGAMLQLLDEHHPEEPDHWYLFLMGVVPDRQGQGIGSSLMREVLATCDAERIPAYLEATCDQNRRLYERHGFRVVRELSLPDGPTGYAMWRHPA